MQVTRLKIFNQALGNIGITETLANTDSNDPIANTLNAFFESVIESTMTLLEWNFLIKETELELESIDYNRRWYYMYHAPDDILDLISIFVTQYGYRANYSHPFEYFQETNMIGSELPYMSVRYTKQIKLPAELPADFFRLVCYDLAIDSVPNLLDAGISVDRARFDLLSRQRALQLSKAMRHNNGLLKRFGGERQSTITRRINNYRV